ncbi:nucleoside hydrolase [Nocardioides sediminis]|uniref:nucleoside hydrolase n=1 Tax=Nocardioides sediminis TaxID=433648 RepID=UPI00131EF613|nr:nucleoside hydrolase [Nocardioides sediminis]
MRLATVAPLLVALVACAPAASDDDGEQIVGGSLAPAPPPSADAVPVVVDSDLAPDDLAAIAYLVRHPDVEVLALTVPTTGMVTCGGGVDLLADFFEAIDEDPVPVACGDTDRGPHGEPFPVPWATGAMSHSGLDRTGAGPLPPVTKVDAATHVARLADRVDGLQVVALGPLTEIAEVRRRRPASYARIAGVTSMAGIVEATSHDAALGVGEWNAAADVDAFADVVAGEVPLTIVPDDPVPPGRPDGLAAPVVSRLGGDPQFASPAFWDLATAGVFTTPEAATVATGTWEVDVEDDRGRLVRTGDGPVRVVTGLDSGLLDAAYAEVFGADLR